MDENRALLLEQLLPDEEATRALAGRLARLAQGGDVFALYGDLGAGKSVFARAFIHARAHMDGAPAEEVPSPTFTLVQTYAYRSGTIWHFDLYRLGGADEVWELGLEEALAGGITLMEWPDRLGGWLPAGTLGVHLAHGPSAEARVVSLVGPGAWQMRLALEAAGG